MFAMEARRVIDGQRDTAFGVHPEQIIRSEESVTGLDRTRLTDSSEAFPGRHKRPQGAWLDRRDSRRQFLSLSTEHSSAAR